MLLNPLALFSWHSAVGVLVDHPMILQNQYKPSWFNKTKNMVLPQKLYNCRTTLSPPSCITTWYPTHPLQNGCFSWMTPNHYMKKWAFHRACAWSFKAQSKMAAVKAVKGKFGEPRIEVNQNGLWKPWPTRPKCLPYVRQFFLLGKGALCHSHSHTL